LETFSTFSFPAANFYHSPYIPNPNTCKAINNSIKNPVNDVRRIKLKFFLTALLKLTSKLVALSSQKQLRTACQVLTHCSNNFTQQTSASLAKKIFYTTELNLRCSITITNGAKICIRFVVYGHRRIQGGG